MTRFIKILLSQLKQLSVSELFSLFRKNIYSNDPIIIYMLAINDDCLKNNIIMDGFVIEKGKINDLEKMKGRLIPLPWEFQCHCYDNVKDFFVARNYAGIQHISWVYYHFNHNRLLIMDEKEAEVKFALTLHAMRGLGVYPKVINMITQYLYHNGMRRIFMCAKEENKSSIRGIEKAGFERVGKINLCKILGIQVSKRFDTSEV